MKGIRYLFFLLTILIPSVAAAATPTQYGESGLVSVPTAEVTERGIYAAAAWFNNSQNNSNKAARFPISLAMGIGFGWEFFGSYPDISFANQEDGSISNFGSVGIKFRLTGGPDSNLKTSGTAFLRQTVSEDETLAGLRDLGTRLIMSYSLAKAGIHLNVGYLKVNSPETKTYNNEVIFGGAIDVPISNKMNSFLELDGNTSREGGSQRIELSPGVQYYLLPSISMMGGVGVGLTDTGPDYRVVVGLTFTSGAGKYAKAIPIIPGSRERYAAMAESSIEELIPDLPMGTTEGIAQEVTVASVSGEASVVPSMEALEAFQAPSPVSQAPLLKPGSKEILTPGGLMGTADVEAVSMEPPMPVILTAPVEKAAAMENIPLAPEVPAEVSTEVFVPPLPVSEEKVEVIEAGKEKAEVHKEVVVETGEGQQRMKRYYVIWYEFRSSELTPFAKGILDRVGVENKGRGERLTVEIAGHTDSIGSAETNKRLSYKRSESAKDYLVIKHGFDPDLFEVKGYGEEMPEASNDTPEGRGKNRRVEITVYSGLREAEVAQALTPPMALTEETYRKPEVTVETSPVASAPPLPEAVNVAPASPLPLPVPAISAAPSQVPEGRPKMGKRILYREVLFLTERSDPSPVVKGILDKMADAVKKSGKHFAITIDGYAGGNEAVSSPEEIAYSRASGIKEYLVQKHGFDPNVFVLKGRGKAAGDAARGRRAEISVYSAAERPEATPSPSPATETPPVSVEPSEPALEEKPAAMENVPPIPALEEKATEAAPPIPEPVMPSAAVVPPAIEAPPLPVPETVSKKEDRPTAGKKVLYKEILFFAEKSDPSPFVQGILDKMVEQIKKGGRRFVIRIDGHADSHEGTNPSKLSYDRANSVKDYLVQRHGFNPNDLEIKGYGSERPVTRDATQEGMKKNRRVEITVFEAKD